MKKLVLISSFFLMIVAGAMAAVHENVTPRILSSFKKEFSFAENVMWRSADNIAFATFSINDKWFTAYFHRDGELLATTRNMLFDELPLAVMQAVSKKYQPGDTQEIYEWQSGGETFYFMTVDSKKTENKIKVSAYGQIEVVKKTRK
ncbi:MAG: hypothetical protein JSU05_06195 [Bacteroidetes bacterium]|nr:hypothetical protein [Bacteroidota bacterium]